MVLKGKLKKTTIAQRNFKKYIYIMNPNFRICCVLHPVLFFMYISFDTSSLTLTKKTMLNEISYKLTNSIFWIVEVCVRGIPPRKKTMSCDQYLSFSKIEPKNYEANATNFHKFARTKCINNKLFT